MLDSLFRKMAAGKASPANSSMGWFKAACIVLVGLGFALQKRWSEVNLTEFAMAIGVLGIAVFEVIQGKITPDADVSTRATLATLNDTPTTPSVVAAIEKLENPNAK